MSDGKTNKQSLPQMETPLGRRTSGPALSRELPHQHLPVADSPSQKAGRMFNSRSLSKQTGDLAILQVRKEPSKSKTTAHKHVFIADVDPNERLSTGMFLRTLTASQGGKKRAWWRSAP